MEEFVYNDNFFVGPRWARSQMFRAWSKNVYLQLISKYNIPQSRLCLDCGAAFGSEAILYQDMFEEIHCFEAFKQNYRVLSKNCAPYDNIKVHNVALNNFIGKTGFYSYNRGPGVGNISDIGVRKAYTKTHETRVNCVTLDSFNFTDVGFIKIDVEGAEKNVLLGATETLKNNSSLLKIEITNDHHDVLDILRSLGYNSIAFDCTGEMYPLDNSFKFNTISDDEIYWSCDNVVVKKEHMLVGRSKKTILPNCPQGMNPCYGDFWFYKS